MRRQSIRFSDEEETIVEQHQRQHHTSSFSKAVLEIIRDYPKIERLEEENTELCAKLEKSEASQNYSFSNDSKVDAHSNSESNQCSHKVSGNRCSLFFLKKGKILKVDPDFCDHCWEKQQKFKVTVNPSTSSIPTMYKKPKAKYCLEATLWIDRLKNMGRCKKCQLDTFDIWAECQRKNMYEPQRLTNEQKKSP